ncbi:glycoside hydrolase family 15 protein [Roseomonas sp. SSH11]|uniref:Glycoside hydrolase family 15 protein n=2 Tax=Pararoseomonas baculiformis TaxID=2820812 RepID=A0ABS4AA07_9PROT|nr:glycoside hydrolase family 15 protein [Pararoseomonas baculiformis]
MRHQRRTAWQLSPAPDLGPERRDYQPIEDYGLLGDGHGSALVARDGSIDWACLERFDSPPLFSRLLDRRRGGFFQIRPAAGCDVTRRYRGHTNTLETLFTSPEGELLLVDALVRDSDSETGRDLLLRQICCLRGDADVLLRFQPLAGFATAFPELNVGTGSVMLWPSGPHLLSDFDWKAEHDHASARLHLRKGDERHVMLTSRKGAEIRQFSGLLAESEKAWTQWCSDGAYAGPWKEPVRRSAMVLKALTFRPTGALVAAPTTSLPEEIGGIRNWDYRYCWLRDACLSFYALKKYGQMDEAEAFLGFVRNLCTRALEELPPLFSVDGSSDLTETCISHFEGYRGSRPVRCGNEAAEQHQIDVYGQVLDLFDLYVRLGGTLDDHLREIGTAMADIVAGCWREPDAGLWEPRQPQQRYVHAAMMCWVAMDRAIRLFGPRAHWVAEREAILEDVRANGVHPSGGHLTQVMQGEAVDGALLLASAVGFPIGDDVLGRTVDKVIEELGHGPLVYRYRTEDGLEGHEGSFVLCAFWLVDALLALGRAEEARTRFEALLGHANDLGLLAEELAEDGSFLGNFPQAFSHLGVIHSALMLDLYEAGGVEAVRGGYADRALRETRNRSVPCLDRPGPPRGAA